MSDEFANQRVDGVPDICPKCGYWMRGGKKRPDEIRYSTGWTPYRMIDGAPAAGCGNCGKVLYLTEPLTMNTAMVSTKD